MLMPSSRRSGGTSTAKPHGLCARRCHTRGCFPLPGCTFFSHGVWAQAELLKFNEATTCAHTCRDLKSVISRSCSPGSRSRQRYCKAPRTTVLMAALWWMLRADLFSSRGIAARQRNLIDRPRDVATTSGSHFPVRARVSNPTRVPAASFG